MGFIAVARDSSDGSLRLVTNHEFPTRAEALVALRDACEAEEFGELMLIDLDAALPVLIVSRSAADDSLGTPFDVEIPPALTAEEAVMVPPTPAPLEELAIEDVPDVEPGDSAFEIQAAIEESLLPEPAFDAAPFVAPVSAPAEPAPVADVSIEAVAQFIAEPVEVEEVAPADAPTAEDSVASQDEVPSEEPPADAPTSDAAPTWPWGDLGGLDLPPVAPLAAEPEPLAAALPDAAPADLAPADVAPADVAPVEPAATSVAQIAPAPEVVVPAEPAAAASVPAPSDAPFVPRPVIMGDYADDVPAWTAEVREPQGVAEVAAPTAIAEPVPVEIPSLEAVAETLAAPVADPTTVEDMPLDPMPTPVEPAAQADTTAPVGTPEDAIIAMLEDPVFVTEDAPEASAVGDAPESDFDIEDADPMTAPIGLDAGSSELDLSTYTCADCVYVLTCPKREDSSPADCGLFQWRS